MLKRETPLVLAFTPNYLIPACTTLVSVLQNSSENQIFKVICLSTEEISEDMKQNLHDFGGERLQFTFLNLEGHLDGIYVDQRYTIAASFRLLLPEILPDFDRVLYLDCDIIVQNDLSVLYHDTDLGSNYLGGVFEAPLAFQIDYWRKIGTDPGYYMNSGFLLMNLALMREDKLVDQFIQASKVDYLQFPDQDVLNQVCRGKIVGLEPYNNAIRTFYLPQYKMEFLQRYTQEQWEMVQRTGNIHYTGGKPWNEYTVQFEKWWKYFFKLPSYLQSQINVDKKLIFLGKFSNTLVGYYLIKLSQFFYRKVKGK